MDSTKRIKTPIAEVFIRDGIMVNEMHVDGISLEAFKAHHDEIEAAFGGLLPLPTVVVTPPNAKQLGRDVRDFMNTEQFKRVTKSLATVAGAGIGRTIVNLFLKFARLPVPLKMFSTVEEAMEWSQQYK